MQSTQGGESGEVMVRLYKKIILLVDTKMTNTRGK